MITKEEACCCDTFYHRTLRNSDGSALRCRRNGMTTEWKRRPEHYRIPVKHGLRQCFYLTPDNTNDWLTFDPTDKPRILKKSALLARLNLETPWMIVHDKLVDDGLEAQATLLHEIMTREIDQ